MALKTDLTPEVVERIAERFRTLGEPARLRIVRELMDGERTVGQLVEATGLGQANASKHLKLLREHGFVGRRREGLFVHYSIANDDVYTLCDIMCGAVGVTDASKD